MPQSYVKVKNVEKKIFMEHRKHIGMSELDAKVLYTKTARDLKTYGVTFFLVKVSLFFSSSARTGLIVLVSLRKK